MTCLFVDIAWPWGLWSLEVLFPWPWTHALYLLHHCHGDVAGYSTSKQSRGILPTKISQPRAGGGLPAGQSGGGPYLRCPFSWTIGNPVRSSSAASAMSVAAEMLVDSDGSTVGDAVVIVVRIAAGLERSLVDARAQVSELGQAQGRAVRRRWT